jgi:hypothetical protein
MEGEFEGTTGGAGAAGKAGGVKFGVGEVVADYLLGALGEAGTV